MHQFQQLILQKHICLLLNAGHIHFFFVNKANAAGENIIEITNNNLIAFHEASNITAILNDLLSKTIGPSMSSENITQEV